jgi:8-oxo-dGTP diphosphatase
LSEEVVKVGVAAIITDKEGRILMGQRKGSHGAGTWSLPGGHIDFGEEPEDTIRREVLEETGLDVGQVIVHEGCPYVNTYFHKEGKQYITLFFVAEYIGGEPQLKEPEKCGGWSWYPHNCLPKPLFGALDDDKFWESVK